MRTQLFYNDAFFQVQPPSPSPSPFLRYNPLLQFPDLLVSIPVAKAGFDLATLSLIAVLLLLSLISFAFIFYLRLKSRRLRHLENFNSLWTVRLLLVTITSIWAVNEILRLPLVLGKHLSFPPITLRQQSDICKIHAVLSLGLLEPSFLVTLLFLINVSIKKRNPSRIWAVASLFTVCAPMTVLQMLLVYFSPFETNTPRFIHGSSVPGRDAFGHDTLLCTYPFFSCLVFGGFAVVYAVVFLFSCWRVMALVINKGMRRRINSLVTAVMVALSAQIACLSLSWLWAPGEEEYGFVVLAMFACVMGIMAIGEVILVIKPIRDALAASEGRPSL